MEAPVISGADGDSSHFKSSGKYFKSGSGPRNFSKRDFDNGPSGKGRDRFAGSNGRTEKTCMTTTVSTLP